MANDADMVKGKSAILFILGGFLVVKSMFFPTVLFDMGTITMRSGLFAGTLLFMTGIMGGAVWDQMKYWSKNLYGHGLNTSFYTDDFHRAGDWVIATRGGIEITGVNFHGKEGIAVFPGISYEWMEKSLLAKAVFIEIEKKNLPRIAREYIEDKGLPTKSIKIALAPAEIHHHNKAYLDWLKEYKDLNSIKEAKRQLMEELENYTRQYASLKEDLNKQNKGQIERLKEKVNEIGSDE